MLAWVQVAGSLGYMAPEMVAKQPYLGRKVGTAKGKS